MKHSMLAAAALSILSLTAKAGEPSGLPALDKEQVTTWVNGLSRCAGVYEVAARLNDGVKPATAKTWRDTARGARFAAMYLLRLERISWNKEAKPLAEFADLVDPEIDVSTTQLQALVENNEADSVEAEMKNCVALRDVQNQLVELLRDELDDR
jgi:hypothetical protein